MFDVQSVWDYIIAITLAAAGGLARLLNKKDRTKLKVSRIVAELFVSGFAGLMTLLLARSFGLTGDWLGLVCGMAGWIGPRILDLLAKPAGQAIGLDMKEQEPKTKKED